MVILVSQDKRHSSNGNLRGGREKAHVSVIPSGQEEADDSSGSDNGPVSDPPVHVTVSSLLAPPSPLSPFLAACCALVLPRARWQARPSNCKE